MYRQIFNFYTKNNWKQSVSSVIVVKTVICSTPWKWRMRIGVVFKCAWRHLVGFKKIVIKFRTSLVLLKTFSFEFLLSFLVQNEKSWENFTVKFIKCIHLWYYVVYYCNSSYLLMLVTQSCPILNYSSNYHLLYLYNLKVYQFIMPHASTTGSSFTIWRYMYVII